MSNINSTIQINNQSTGLVFQATSSRETDKDGFSASEITVKAVEESVVSEYPTPRHVTLRLLNGDDVRVGVATGVYPFRLSGDNEAMSLRLDVEGRREFTTITADADTAGSLGGDYLVLRELDNAIVWPWFNIPLKAKGTLTLTGNAGNNETVVIGAKTYTFKTSLTPAANEVFIGATASDSIDNLIAAVNAGAGSGTLYGTGTTANASAVAAVGSGDTMVATAITAGTAGNAIASTDTMADGAWGDTTLINGTAGSSAPTPTTERLIRVDVAEGATAAAVATALHAAFDGDEMFTATISGAVVVVTNRHTGTRTAATVGTTGWAGGNVVASTTGAASPTVFLLSAGISQILVAIAPN